MTTFLKVKDRARSTLAGAINNTDDPVTFSVQAGDGAKFGDTPFVVTIEKISDQTFYERLKCTSRTNDSLTCVRAQEGTTKKAFSENDLIEIRVTAARISDLNTAVNALEGGAVNGLALNPVAVGFTIAGGTDSKTLTLNDNLNASTVNNYVEVGHLPLAGGTMAGNIAMDDHSITDLPAPATDNDAARKKYVDGPPFVYDVDDNKYCTVRIGKQIWLAQNLRVKHTPSGGALTSYLYTYGSAWQASTAYNVGDFVIPTTINDFYYECTTAGTTGGTEPIWPTTIGNTVEDGGVIWTCRQVDEEKEGRLYKWADMMNSDGEGGQGIAPEGFHIPTDAEFKELERYLGMKQSEVDGTDWRGTNEGKILKSLDPIAGMASDGLNTVGFNALLAGYRGTDGSFSSRDSGTYIWSSLESGGNAWIRLLYLSYAGVYRDTSSKLTGFSVRCLKD